ncbi:O-methyltransferase [Halobacillus litoralis]|uniref:O-methyltransferase n=1 Tax=Halobacillus litoralis TaxID=45668 RepID=UPI001CFDE2DC|nr:O-methyltransferase [Halobacillus litoralis]
MSEKNTWREVDQYFVDRLIPEDSAMQKILKSNEEAGLPGIDVSAAQGKLLHLLVKIKAAKNVLEIGTLGGYSSIWMAKALPEGGHLTTLEFNPKHAEVASKNMSEAGVIDKISLRTGPALKTLPTLREESPFDFIFIDADKNNNARYLEEILKLSTSGTTIVVDNVVREGRVLDVEGNDPDIQGIRDMFDLLHQHPRLESTALQTVGSKGYDGIVLSIVK